MPHRWVSLERDLEAGWELSKPTQRDGIPGRGRSLRQGLEGGNASYFFFLLGRQKRMAHLGHSEESVVGGEHEEIRLLGGGWIMDAGVGELGLRPGGDCF